MKSYDADSVADLTFVPFALALTATFAGAIIQGSIGFGYALVAVPALTLIRPEALPATILLLAFPMTILMALRERRAIDVPGFAWMTAGRTVGIGGGLALLTAVPARSLSILLGAFILLGVLLSGLAPDLEVKTSTRLIAGVASGVMGTAAGIGGPALALVYQSRPGPQLRSTLALSFAVGIVLSIAGLAAAGRAELWHALLALRLLPALLLGLLVARTAARWLDERWLRPAVLAFAAISGVVAIVQGAIS